MAVKWSFKKENTQLEQRVQTLETQQTTNTTNITTLQNDTIKTSGNQSRSGELTLTNTGTPLIIKPNSDTATFMAGYQSNNRRLYFIGKGTSNEDSLIIGTDRGPIKFQAATWLEFNGKTLAKVGTPNKNDDAATKLYVDQIKTQLKEKVAQSTDFADFKTKISNW